MCVLLDIPAANLQLEDISLIYERDSSLVLSFLAIVMSETIVPQILFIL